MNATLGNAGQAARLSRPRLCGHALDKQRIVPSRALSLHENYAASQLLRTLRISTRLKHEAASKADEKDKKSSDSASPELQVMPDAMPEPLVNNLSIMSVELRAGLLMAKKLNDDAKKLYAQAAPEEKALGYREPPAYIRPVGENQAAAFITASDWTGAKAANKGALVERPRSGFPLDGIAPASEQAGDITAATTEFKDFLAAWFALAKLSGYFKSANFWQHHVQ